MFLGRTKWILERKNQNQDASMKKNRSHSYGEERMERSERSEKPRARMSHNIEYGVEKSHATRGEYTEKSAKNRRSEMEAEKYVKEPMKTTASAHNEMYNPRGMSIRDNEVGCKTIGSNSKKSIFAENDIIW
jgi:hypothetical protein